MPFLIVFAHATGIAWDEIVPITLIGLTIALGLALFVAARRFKPDDEPETGEDAR